MEFSDLIAAVFAGNVLAVAFVWGMAQFHKHDYKAPWLAFAATLMPLILVVLSLISTEGLPPQFDALVLR